MCPACPETQHDGARGTRTPDLLGAIQALSQLSYSPVQVGRRRHARPEKCSGRTSPGERSMVWRRNGTARRRHTRTLGAKAPHGRGSRRDSARGAGGAGTRFPRARPRGAGADGGTGTRANPAQEARFPSPPTEMGPPSALCPSAIPTMGGIGHGLRRGTGDGGAGHAGGDGGRPRGSDGASPVARFSTPVRPGTRRDACEDSPEWEIPSARDRDTAPRTFPGRNGSRSSSPADRLRPRQRLLSRPPSPKLGALRGHSSAGRAPALQAGGHRFDPGWLHSGKCPQTGGFQLAAADYARAAEHRNVGLLPNRCPIRGQQRCAACRRYSSGL